MPKPDLRAVSSELPEPPYSKETRAKGIKFEIDIERLYQSKTWLICPNEIKPWLLRLWTESWRSIPVGSFEQDDEIVAARIGMDLRLFMAHKDLLMRGWYPCNDRRIYHTKITEQALSLIDWRNNERERKAEYRERQLQRIKDQERTIKDLQAMSHGTDADGHGKDDTIPIPIPIPSEEREEREEKKQAKKKEKPASWGTPPWIDQQAWSDFEQHRREINKPLTDMARTKAANQLQGMSPQQQRDCVDKSIQARWTGLFPEKQKANTNEPTQARRTPL